MTKVEQAEVTRKCRMCAFGGLENGKPRCFHWYHPGYMWGSGVEWVIACPEFKDTGKPGVVVVTTKLVR